MRKAIAFYDPSKTYEDNFELGPFIVSDADTAHPPQGEPQYTFLGHPIYTPFGIPAGPLLNSNYVKYAFERGFDVVCYKTQRTVPFACNAFPNVLAVDTDGDLTLAKAAEPLVGMPITATDTDVLSITNSFGVPSRGPDYWVPDLRTALTYQGKGQLLIAAVQGTIQDGFGPDDYYADFAAAAALAAEAGAQVIEVNLSCPNVATEGVICYRPDAVIPICQKVKERIGDIPLLVKLGYFSADQQALLEKIIAGILPYVAGVSAINTIAAPIVDAQGNQALPGPNRLKSGVCGAGIAWAGLDMVSRLAALRKKLGVELAIIGVGGVMSPVDFAAYREAGADLVQAATGAMWNPGLAAEIKASLQ
jgi:dihydroorotate dehydrogenase (NAD+) catalytic subunit